MIVERVMDPGYLSNGYLVAEGDGGNAVFVDAGAAPGPLLEVVERRKLKVSHVLLTHHHGDHTRYAGELARRFGCAVAGHPAERELFGGLDVQLEHGAELTSGGLRIRALHVPGHTVGQLAFVVGEERVFTGDTLFRGAVGGTRAPGHGSFEQLRRSIMEVLMKLPHAMPAHPGHTDPTTIGREWEGNPFIRLWRGTAEPDGRRCTALDRPATLLVEARDYDGGTKCQVQFDEGDLIDVVPGSRVRIAG